MTRAEIKKREDFLAPGRLWSLMDMLPVNAHSLMSALSALDSMKAVAENRPQNVFIEPGMKQWFIDNIDIVDEQVKILHMNLSSNQCRFIRILTTGIKDASEVEAAKALICPALDELRKRINEELASKKVYAVRSELISFMDRADAPFGQPVVDAFPDSITDASEAALCLALSRNTACVFHLMRVCEHAVLRLGQKIEVTVIDKNNKDLEWGKILSNINDRITTMPKGDIRDTWSAVSALLFHVKNAWRNTTMHPKQVYTDEEAQTVFNATKSFMTFLAPLV